MAAHDAGADAVFVEAPLDRDELARIGAELTGRRPLANMGEGGRTPLLSLSELDALGFRLVLWGITGILAAGAALRAAYAAIRATGEGPSQDGLMSFTELTDAVGLPEHRAHEDRYAAE
jgi:methylisocitrate lyase